MKYIITGCYGFIGRHLAKFLLENGDKVLGIDIYESDCFASEKNFSFKKMDFNNQLFSCEDINKYDVLFHLAWSGVSTSDKNDYKKQFKNFEITYKILEITKELNIKKLIIPGSVSEYSKSKKPITGCEKYSPSDLYAATKIGIHSICEFFCEKNNISLNWLLITSIYAEDRRDNNLINSAIQSFKNKKIFECTKLEQEWDYIYIDDLVRALFLISKKGEKNKVYPIGSGRTEKLRYYIETISNIMNSQEYLMIGAVEYKNKHIDNSVVDISSLLELGFYCSHSFEYNIRKVISKIMEE